MKLNIYQKDGIVRAIMQDVPKPQHDTIKKEIQVALVAAMSATARKLYNTNPKALRVERAYGSDYGLDHGVDLIVGDADMNVVAKPWRTEEDQRKAAERQLKGAVAACITLKQLNDRLPEFKKYFPTEAAPTANLPALANVVADLSKLGWPKKGLVK